MKNLFLLSLFLPISIYAKAFPNAPIPPTINVKACTIPQAPKINLNQATIKELQGSFKGIGLKRAQAIFQYRQHHRFQNIEEISQVKGLGKKFVQRNHSALKARFSI